MWRQALQQLAEGCGQAFAAAATPELRGLLLRGMHHPNRFVREAAYYTLAALCACAPPGSLDAWGAEAAARLQDGLSENWSQVGHFFFGHWRRGHIVLSPAGTEKGRTSRKCALIE